MIRAEIQRTLERIVHQDPTKRIRMVRPATTLRMEHLTRHILKTKRRASTIHHIIRGLRTRQLIFKFRPTTHPVEISTHLQCSKQHHQRVPLHSHNRYPLAASSPIRLRLDDPNLTTLSDTSGVTEKCTTEMKYMRSTGHTIHMPINVDTEDTTEITEYRINDNTTE
jgi:hypothetical protein